MQKGRYEDVRSDIIYSFHCTTVICWGVQRRLKYFYIICANTFMPPYSTLWPKLNLEKWKKYYITPQSFLQESAVYIEVRYIGVRFDPWCLVSHLSSGGWLKPLISCSFAPVKILCQQRLLIFIPSLTETVFIWLCGVWQERNMTNHNLRHSTYQQSTKKSSLRAFAFFVWMHFVREPDFITSQISKIFIVCFIKPLTYPYSD